MPQTIGCPGCSTKLKVPDNAAGRRVKCPTCQTVLTVPSGVEPAPVVRPPVDAPPATPAEPVPPPPAADPPPARARRAAEDADDERPVPAARAARRRDDDDDSPPRREEETALPPKKVKFPQSVQLAGLAWLAVAVLQVVSVTANIVTFVSSDQRPNATVRRTQPPNGVVRPGQPAIDPQAQTAGVFCSAGVGLLLFLVFGITGLQALRGSVSTVIGAGVASLILGVLALLGFVALLVTNGPDVSSVIGLVAVLALLVGGISALAGGKQYTKWRKWKKAEAQVRKGSRRAAPQRAADGSDDRERDDPRPVRAAAVDRDNGDDRPDHSREGDDTGRLHKGWKSVALGYRMFGLQMLFTLLGVPAVIAALTVVNGWDAVSRLMRVGDLPERDVESLLLPFGVYALFALLIGLFSLLGHAFLMGMPKDEKGGKGSLLAMLMFLFLFIPGLGAVNPILLPLFSAGVGTALNKPRLRKYGLGLYVWYAVGFILLPLLAGGAWFGVGAATGDRVVAALVGSVITLILGLLVFFSVWGTYAGIRRGIQASIRDRGIIGGEDHRPVKRKRDRRDDDDDDDRPRKSDRRPSRDRDDRDEPSDAPPPAAAKRAVRADVDDDDRPKKQKRDDEVSDDEIPRAKKQRDNDEDSDDDRPRKRR